MDFILWMLVFCLLVAWYCYRKAEDLERAEEDRNLSLFAAEAEQTGYIGPEGSRSLLNSILRREDEAVRNIDGWSE